MPSAQCPQCLNTGFIELAQEHGKRAPCKCADEVVKDLDWFTKDACIKFGYHGSLLPPLKIQLLAQANWYKHQLEEKQANHESDAKFWKHKEDKLLATIEEQKKEIEEKRKVNNALFNSIKSYQDTINKLTQENEALKQK